MQNETQTPETEIEVVVSPETEVASESEAKPEEVAATEEVKEEGEQAERDDKGRFKGNVQKRIDELTFRRNEAERDAAYWRSQAQAKMLPAPKESDYQNNDEYNRAVLDYRIKTGVNSTLQEHNENRAKLSEDDAKVALNQTYQARLAAFVSTVPDFDELSAKVSNVSMPTAFIEAIQESEFGPQIYNSLIRNPDSLMRFAQMSERQINKEIGKMEATISVKPAARTTNAPPPVKPGVSARSSASDPAKMSMEEYKAMRKTQGAKWAK